MRRIVSLPVLAAFVVLGASCSQQVQQPGVCQKDDCENPNDDCR